MSEDALRCAISGRPIDGDGVRLNCHNRREYVILAVVTNNSGCSNIRKAMRIPIRNPTQAERRAGIRDEMDVSGYSDALAKITDNGFAKHLGLVSESPALQVI